MNQFFLQQILSAHVLNFTSLLSKSVPLLGLSRNANTIISPTFRPSCALSCLIYVHVTSSIFLPDQSCPDFFPCPSLLLPSSTSLVSDFVLMSHRTTAIPLPGWLPLFTILLSSILSILARMVFPALVGSFPYSESLHSF